MSTYSTKIRDKFRQQIRSRQIQEFMRITRTKALNYFNASNNKFNVFVGLDEKITRTAKMPIDIQTVDRLIKLIQQYTQEDNTYILIGNYIMYHGQAWRYFGMRLLGVSDIAYKLENYKRAILLTLSRTEEISVKILNQYDAALAQILQASNQVQLPLNLHFLNIILNLQNISKQIRYFPTLSLTQFFKIITFVEIKQLKAQTKYNIMAVMHNLIQYHLECGRGEGSEGQNQIIKNYLPQIIKIITLGIQEYVSFRSQFIVAVKIIAINYADKFQDIFKTKLGENLLMQLYYMYQNLPQQRLNLLTIFQAMINQFEFNLFLNLLNLGLHVILARTLTQGIQNPANLHNCLKTIILILNRLRQRQQKQLIDKVLNSMQQQHFQNILQQLLAIRQDPQVQKVLSQLVDDYYSDQVA